MKPFRKPTLAEYTASQMRFAPYGTFAPSKFRWTHLLAAIIVVGLAFSTAPGTAQAQSSPAKSLRIYSIDVEGGQSTLLVGPSGSSLLVDAGWPGNNGRDAGRVQAAMHDAGITRIDHLLVTHYHMDHVGGVPELAKRVPIGEFLDHGDNREDSDVTRHDYAAYLSAISGKPRRIVHPGDTIEMPGLSVTVLTADGEHIRAIPGINPQHNPYCGAEPEAEADPSENARSTGILVTYGRFRFLDLGDLTKAKEIALVCPDNPIPAIDLYLVTHHGMNLSNAKAIVDAIRPRVAIMNNGAHKAGMPEAWQTVHDSPRLQDLYMVHTAEGSDAAHNSPEALIANPKGGTTDGAYFKVVAHEDGGFSVTNRRTGQTKDYAAK